MRVKPLDNKELKNKSNFDDIINILIYKFKNNI